MKRPFISRKLRAVTRQWDWGMHRAHRLIGGNCSNSSINKCRNVESSHRPLTAFTNGARGQPCDAMRPGAADYSPFQECPSVVLVQIFKLLPLTDRVRTSRTCRRFHRIIKERMSGATLTVLNMFQKKVYDDNVQRTKITSLILYRLPSIRQIRSFLSHVRRIDSLKIWFHDDSFVEKVLDSFDGRIEVGAVDVYPYEQNEPLGAVARTFPTIHALTMRPHGEHFFNGLQLPSMPAFEHLSTLSMESYDLMPGFRFPPLLRNLDFSHRKLFSNAHFFEPLSKLNLEYLAVSHIRFDKTSRSFNQFIHAISKMTKLEILLLKFCHLNANADDLSNVRIPIRQLQFDLCYDVSYSVMKLIVELSRKTIRRFFVTILYEDDEQLANVLRLVPLLHCLRISLSFSIMQRETNKLGRIRPPPPLPKGFHSVLSRFEASYLLKPDLLGAVFSHHCCNLMEAKFVNAHGLNNRVLELMAKNCPLLTKLTISWCTEVSEEALLAFVTHFDVRATSKPLTIVYETSHFGAVVRLYGELHATLSHDARFEIRYDLQTLANGETAGERLHVHARHLERSLLIKNYTHYDSHSLLGLIIDDDVVHADDITATYASLDSFFERGFPEQSIEAADDQQEQEQQ